MPPCCAHVNVPLLVRTMARRGAGPRPSPCRCAAAAASAIMKVTWCACVCTGQRSSCAGRLHLLRCLVAPRSPPASLLHLNLKLGRLHRQQQRHGSSCVSNRMRVEPLLPCWPWDQLPPACDAVFTHSHGVEPAHGDARTRRLFHACVVLQARQRPGVAT